MHQLGIKLYFDTNLFFKKTLKLFEKELIENRKKANEMRWCC